MHSVAPSPVDAFVCSWKESKVEYSIQLLPVRLMHVIAPGKERKVEYSISCSQSV